MRPREFPAEDAGLRRHLRGAGGASMRPREFPAEDQRVVLPPVRGRLRFNEAAGIPRGRLHGCTDEGRASGASMRPREFPAEDARAIASTTTRWSFNEAAGIPRGRLAVPPFLPVGLSIASMRPREFPAEDLHQRGAPARCTRASMRPREFPAEDFAPTSLGEPGWRLQ